MFSRLSAHTRAVIQAVIVTLLWSSSWVLIKIGLQDDIPALTFAGLRYCLATLCLVPLLLRRPREVKALRALPRRGWLRLAVLGLLYYTVTQGAQFVGLATLPTLTVNLLLSFQALIVTIAGISLLRERPTGIQWIGTGVFLIGVLVYFIPVTVPEDQALGLLAVIAGVIAGSASSLLSRSINRAGALSPLAVTVASMSVGAVALLSIGVLFQGLPPLRPASWAIIGWLAVVNTALAFTLWNHTLRTLSAMESSVINNLMMAEIPVLAWLFLGEGIQLKAGIGFTIAALGILVVQLRRLPFRRQALAPQAPFETDIAETM